MATEFSSVWVKLRKEAGFKSAYDFFHRNGGQKVLKLSFVNYWRIEQGKLLPKAGRLSRLVACLRLEPHAKEAEQLLWSYLKHLIGSGEDYQWVHALLSGKRNEAAGPLTEHHIMRRAMKERIYHVSVEQMRAVLRNFHTYWSFQILLNEKSPMEISALSKLLRVPEKRLARGLKKLAENKLIESLPKNKARCPLAGKLLAFPPMAAMTREESRAITMYHRKMAYDHGSITCRRYVLLRAVESELANAYSSFDEAVKKASIYSTYEKQDGSALFLAEGTVYKLASY